MLRTSTLLSMSSPAKFPPNLGSGTLWILPTGQNGSVALAPGYRDSLSRPENWQLARKLTKNTRIALFSNKIAWDEEFLGQLQLVTEKLSVNTHFENYYYLAVKLFLTINTNLSFAKMSFALAGRKTGQIFCIRPENWSQCRPAGVPFLTDKKKMRAPTSHETTFFSKLGCRGSQFFLISQKW